MRKPYCQIPVIPVTNRGVHYCVVCIVLVGAAIWLTGCRSSPYAQSSVHSMWNLASSAQTTPLNTGVHPAYGGPIFLTEGDLPDRPPAEQIARIDAGAVSDQPTETVLMMLANEARKAGANAVFHVKLWRQGSGFTWNAPQGSGIAVRLTDTNTITSLNGYWY